MVKFVRDAQEKIKAKADQNHYDTLLSYPAIYRTRKPEPLRQGEPSNLELYETE
jgi:hypothetical protein